MDSAAVAGSVDFTVYLPPGYDASDERYPTLYLLHGRGDSRTAWTPALTDLEQLVADGAMPPTIAVMPDASWSGGGHWYVNSRYTGTDCPGRAVETALVTDLVRHIDMTYRTVADRRARAVAGYSMGGFGALRYVLAHQQLYSKAIVLSPAVFTPLPPAEDDIRNFGAFGVGTAKFDDRRYDALNYPALLPRFDPAQPCRLFLAVGDKDWVNPDPVDATHDVDFETAIAYGALKRVPGITADLRVLGGGHDWGVWRPALAAGLALLATG
jgi:enterochelin esterase-like enzyme